MIKLGNYEANKSAQETLKENEIKMLRENLITLIKQIESTFQSDVADIADTYSYVTAHDKQFAEKLWADYLQRDQYSKNKERIQVNSYFGFSVHDYGMPYYFHIVTTPNGVGCYYDRNKCEYQKDNWRFPKDIKDGLAENGLGYTKEQLECMIDSAQKFIAYFPAYRDGFFKCVSERKVE